MKPAGMLLVVCSTCLVWMMGLRPTQAAVIQTQPTPPHLEDFFGVAVAVSEDGQFLVVGAPGHDNSAIDAGSAFVYRWDDVTQTWGQEFLLKAKIQAAGDACGTSVDITYDYDASMEGYIIVGCPKATVGGYSNAGRALFFRLINASTNTWEFEQYKTASPVQSNSRYGHSVGLLWNSWIDYPWAFVGAPYEMETYANEGSVYWYKRKAYGGKPPWYNDGKIKKQGGAAQNDFFGLSIATYYTGAILFGAPGHDGGRGCVDSWIPSGSILPPWDIMMTRGILYAEDEDPGDFFGWSVANDGEIVVVGAFYDSGTGTGAAYIFEAAPMFTWTQVVKLNDLVNPVDPLASADFFGYSVACWGGEKVLVGAPSDSDLEYHAGAAYLFEYNSGLGEWEYTSQIIAPDAGASDSFGFGVAQSETMDIIGAPGWDSAYDDSGTVYTFY